MEILEWINKIVTVIFFVTVAVAAGIYGIVAVSLRREAPYVPSPKKVAEMMMELARVQTGDIVVDLGSGDGTLLLAAAKRGATAVGYELSRPLAWWTRIRAFFSGQKRRIMVHRKDLFTADIRSATVVSCYLMPAMLARLRDTFRAQLSPGSRIIVSRFEIEGWTPIEQTIIDQKQLSLYEISRH